VASTEVAQRLAGSLVRPEWQTADEDVPAQMKLKRIPVSYSSSADQTRFPVYRWYAQPAFAMECGPGMHFKSDKWRQPLQISGLQSAFS
jgi:hypothetical protein